jgi:hypothetical protein
MTERRTTNSERRLRRLAPEEEPVDEDAALTREADDAEQ